MDSQCPLEVMAGTKSAGVVVEDKENKTTDGIEKKGESKVISTTTPNRPPVRESAKEGKRSDDEMEQNTKCPPRRCQGLVVYSYHST